MLLYLLIWLVLFFLARVAWTRWKYDVHKIPSPRGWPLIGQGLHYINERVEISRVRGRFFKELGYPKIMKVNVFGRTHVSVVDAHTVKSLILKSNDIPKAKLYHVFSMLSGNDPTARSMFLTTNLTPYVKKIRRVYAPAFLGSHLKRMVPKLNSALDKMLETVKTDP